MFVKKQGMPFQNGRNAVKMGEMPFHGVPFHFQKCIFKIHGNFYFTPVFFREKINSVAKVRCRTT